MRYKKIVVFYGLAMMVGVVTGALSALFQWAIHKTISLLQLILSVTTAWGIPGSLTSALLTCFAVCSVWFWVQRVAPDASGSGIPEIEGALLHKFDMRWRRLLPVKFIGGVAVIASNVVAGREGPTIQMGGHVGKMFAEYFKLSPKRCDALIASGAGAGLAAAFNAPLAGVLFVMEEMRHVFALPFIHFKTVAISCVAASVVLQHYFGGQPAIVMPVFSSPSLASLWLFFLFGLVIGLLGMAFNGILIHVLTFLDRQNYKKRVSYVVIVAFLIGYLANIWPNAVGGGYAIIDRFIVLMPDLYTLVGLFLVRFLTTILCYGLGVPGGIFAPMLALGTLAGLAMDCVLHAICPNIQIAPGMLAVAGMGALFSATVRAPVTGIVLVVEMTQNYALILPLMVSCLTATTVVQLAGIAPIYTQLLHRRTKLAC